MGGKKTNGNKENKVSTEEPIKKVISRQSLSFGIGNKRTFIEIK